MKFNRKKFFDGYRVKFGKLAQSQVDAIENLLSFMESDSEITDYRFLAYMFATVKHECTVKGVATFLPVEEVGHGRGHKYGLIIKATGHAYYGRGYVQLTWNYNYINVGQAVGLGNSLYLQPALALIPKTAYLIMSYGMRNGTFTGKKLSHYINDLRCDYFTARKIINGLDCASLIKGYAIKFDNILKGSLI
jgi:putative chitinase